jgi:hypothetical protein
MIRWGLVFLLRTYQAIVSPLLPAACRFHPTCSAYAVEAVRTHGPLRGSWLALRRLSRCRPGWPGGEDPVPHGDPGAGGTSA